MSVVHLVALPRGRDANGELWCSVIWSPLPPRPKGLFVEQLPDAAALADWPATIARLTVTLTVGGQKFTGEPDLSAARSDVWRAVVATAPPVAGAPVFTAPDLPLPLTYSMKQQYQQSQQIEQLVQEHGLLRYDAPLVAGANGPGEGQSSASGTGVIGSIGAYAAATTKDVDDIHQVLAVDPDAELPAPSPPPTLAELLAAARSRPALARTLGLVVPVRLVGSATATEGPQWLTAQVEDPEQRLTLVPTEATPCLVGVSFTLLDEGGTALDHLDARDDGEIDVLDYDPVATKQQQSTEATVQPQVSRGFEFIRDDLVTRVVGRQTRQLARASSAVVTSSATKPVVPEQPPSGQHVRADFVNGFRVDVATVDGAGGSSAWRSLMWRRNEIGPSGGQSFPGSVVDDEGELGLNQTRTATSTSVFGVKVTTSVVDEHVGCWTGWSLGAPRVGLGQAVGPQAAPGELDDPNTLPGEFGVNVVVRPPVVAEHPERALTPLRFGRDYRFRLRPSDLAGWSPPPPTGDTFCSPVHPFRRRERIGPPVVVLGAVPTEGESAEELVIRSVAEDPRPGEPADPTALAAMLTTLLGYPYADVAVRHLLPPLTSVVTAEQHGAFDGLVGQPDGIRRSLRVAAKVDGTFGHPGFIDTETDPGTGPVGATSPTGLSLVPRRPTSCPADLAAKLGQSASTTTATEMTTTIAQWKGWDWPKAAGDPLEANLTAAYLGSEPLRCPHLPDPAGRRLMVRLVHGLTEVATAELEPYAGHGWPEPRGWRVVLAAGPEIGLAKDTEARTLTVRLPAGRTAELEVSAAPDPDQLGLFHSYASAADQAAVGALILAGRHTSVQAELVLRLRHAVLRPNAGKDTRPILGTSAHRTPSGPDLRLFGYLVTDQESTAAVDVRSTWTTRGAGPPTLTQAHAADLERIPIDQVDVITLGLGPDPAVPVPPRPAEDVVAVLPIGPKDAEKEKTPGGFLDPSDPFESMMDLVAQVSRVDLVTAVPAADTGPGSPWAELTTHVQSGAVAMLVRDAAGAHRVVGVEPRMRGMGRARAGLAVPDVVAPVVPVAPVSRPAPAVGDRPAAELTPLDLGAARLQLAAETAFGAAAQPFTVADALLPRTGPAALLDLAGADVRSISMLAVGPGNAGKPGALSRVVIDPELVVKLASVTDYWHHVADTRHLSVTYEPLAHTRYREDFPARLTEPAWASWWGRRGHPLTVQVAATVAPPVPKVTRMISAVHELGALPPVGPTIPVTTAGLGVGPGLRVYLGPTWYASGEGEKLGVVVLDGKPDGQFPSPTEKRVDPEEPRPVSEIVSTLGRDPMTPLQRGPLNQPPVKQDPVRYLFAGDLLAGEPLGPQVIGDPEATTYEPAAYPLPRRTEAATAGPRAASVIAHPVRWSAERRQYYADLRFRRDLTGYFVRLSLCRFQPWGLVYQPAASGKDVPEVVDLRCSTLLLTEFVWLNSVAGGVVSDQPVEAVGPVGPRTPHVHP